MLRKIYGPERDRTADLLNANQALSQLSYRPVAGHGDMVERFVAKSEKGFAEIPRSTLLIPVSLGMFPCSPLRTYFAEIPRTTCLIPVVLGTILRFPLKAKNGGPNRNCTCDPRVISTVLY